MPETAVLGSVMVGVAGTADGGEGVAWDEEQSMEARRSARCNLSLSTKHPLQTSLEVGRGLKGTVKPVHILQKRMQHDTMCSFFIKLKE